MITFRLFDALPASVTSDLEGRLPSTRDGPARRRLEDLLDAGHGACYMHDERVGSLVERTLLHFDSLRYRLLAWVIMPNHVHILVETFAGYSVSAVIHSWKSYTAKEANRLLGRQGEFWQSDYFDRVIRNEDHLQSAVEYIHSNPWRAGLVGNERDWSFSSARHNDWSERIIGLGSVIAGKAATSPDVGTGTGGTPALRP